MYQRDVVAGIRRPRQSERMRSTAKLKGLFSRPSGISRMCGQMPSSDWLRSPSFFAPTAQADPEWTLAGIGSRHSPRTPRNAKRTFKTRNRGFRLLGPLRSGNGRWPWREVLQHLGHAQTVNLFPSCSGSTTLTELPSATTAHQRSDLPSDEQQKMPTAWSPSSRSSKRVSNRLSQLRNC